ncbi:TcpE family conjugal transfer membrane protein [Streptococcus sp. zg-JUN1979]|uniref:TcpE family conjugal transfer membrane protein n=1 Tax=Streptococcus sp. zg-JUN1979 TaxID=3391450 RepID=UPI0039A74E9E
MDRPDKELYSYKQALSQPYWIQRLTDSFSLSSAVKLSFFIYGFVVAVLTWYLLDFLVFFLPWGLRGVLSLGAGIYLGGQLSDVVVDGKAFVFYLKDYLVFYIKYGMSEKSIYINKGQVYQKPKERRKRVIK